MKRLHSLQCLMLPNRLTQPRSRFTVTAIKHMNTDSTNVTATAGPRGAQLQRSVYQQATLFKMQAQL